MAACSHDEGDGLLFCEWQSWDYDHTLASSAGLGLSRTGSECIWLPLRVMAVLTMIILAVAGLRIAPPEAPATGYMFGKGVYFADMVSKSANYCYHSRGDPVGVLLLCEVPSPILYKIMLLYVVKLPLQFLKRLSQNITWCFVCTWMLFTEARERYRWLWETCGSFMVQMTLPINCQRECSGEGNLFSNFIKFCQIVVRCLVSKSGHSSSIHDPVPLYVHDVWTEGRYVL